MNRGLSSLRFWGLAAIAIVSAVIVVLIATYGGGGTAAHPVTPPLTGDGEGFGGDGRPQIDLLAKSGIDARGTLEPRIVLFGDTIDAYVDVVVDRQRVDPDTVHVAAEFSPWEIVSEPTRARREAGTTVFVRTTYAIRCLTGLCLSPGQSMQLEFPPARVTFTKPAAVGRQAETESMRVEWPVLTVYSRFTTSSFEGRAALATPWHADLTTLPVLSERVEPGLLLALLIAAGVLFAVAGGSLVYVARPKRAYAPPPEPEAPLPPPLSPLQQALALLEDAARSNGTEDRRRSLELVAEVLDDWGDGDLARSARNLAWSESAPAVEETSGLATRVRETLELEDRVSTEDGAGEREGDGRVA